MHDAVEYVIAWMATTFGITTKVPGSDSPGKSENGQATPEYALVILAAVALAATLIVWAKKSGAMAELFEFVIGKVKEAADK